MFNDAKFTRAMAIIAAGMFATYSLFNPLFISWEDTLGVALGQARQHGAAALG